MAAPTRKTSPARSATPSRVNESPVTRTETGAPLSMATATRKTAEPAGTRSLLVSRIVAGLHAFGVALLSFLAFIGGATLFLAVVPADARLAASGVLLIIAGVALALSNASRAEANARAAVAAELGEREAELSLLRAENEQLQDDIWRLRESDERHRDVLDTLGDVVTRWREGGESVYANDAARALFPDGRIVGLHGDLEGPTGEAREDILVETVHGPRWFARRDVAVRDVKTGEPLIQTILRDVTDRRRIEDALVAARNQAETASAAKSRFLATVSHEIRTPLNGILGMTDLLADTRLTAEQRSYVEAVKSSGEILLLLISEVLDMSRIEAGRLELSPAPTDVALLAEGVAELLSPRAFGKGLEVGCLVDPRMPDRIEVDATRLRQILYNLAGNGLKFTEEGGVEIRVERESEERFAILVRDTGIGFTADDAERLFEEFEQVDHGPARRFDGAGLGLTISRRLARLMGGEITAGAAPGEGACFRVELPLRPAPPLSRGNDTDPAPSPETWLAGKSVVILSESRIEVPLVSRRLGAFGARVTEMPPCGGEDDDNRDQALAEADLILLDPTGLRDAGAWLASARAAGVEAPAIAIIAPTDRTSLPRLKAAGFGAYLIRPIRSATLSQVTRVMLEPGSGPRGWEVAGQSRPRQLDDPGGTAPVRPLKVLVADDNDINRLLSEAMVRKFGHEAVVAANGSEALAAVADGSFDMILMDLHMPGIDGVTAIRRFRALEEERGWGRIPVLAVTADVTAAAEDAALAAGADGVITKPIDPDLMRQRLSAATG